MREFESIEELQEMIGQEIAVSDWVEITQSRIDQFAEATGDFQWIHVDPVRAASGPFGSTIAHGFLTLSLLPMLLEQSVTLHNSRFGLNYGLNRVRFPAPVPVGSRLRGRIKIQSIETLPPLAGMSGAQIVWEVTMEREGSDKPVCVAESVTRRYS